MAYELFFDGFEHYSATADLLLHGYTGNSNSLSSNGGRRGGKAWVIGWTVGSGLIRPITAATHVVLGAAIKVSTAPAYIRFYNGATLHAELTITPNAVMSLAAGGVNVGNSGNVYPVNTFMFVELGLAVANAGGSYEVRVNGSSVGWFPPVAADTQNGATTTITSVGITGTATPNATTVDDFYITYGDELKWLGDSRIDKLLLTANATPQDWTPDSGNAWERLNAGTGYIASSTDEATSLFEFADLPYTPQTIHGLSIRSRLLKNNTNFRSATALIKSGATEQEGTELALSTDALGHTLQLINDPATGLPWDFAGIAAAQAGVRVKG